jgi:hypothetical protein
VTATITWAGGAITTGVLVRPAARLDQLSYYSQTTGRIRDLAAQGRQATAIARVLHVEGYRPAKAGSRISDGTVGELMRRLDCPAGTVRNRRPMPTGEELGPDEWRLDQLAAELDMPNGTLHTWIRRGWLRTRRESRHPWRLIADSDELAELRERRTRPPGWYSQRRWNDDHDPVTQHLSVQCD